MRGVLGASCPWEGCPEAVSEACREGGHHIAYCAAGHDSLIAYNGPTDFTLYAPVARAGFGSASPPVPRPGPLSAPDHSASRRWGKPKRDWGQIAFIAIALILVMLWLAFVGTELPY